jgi:mannose-1-phosphate guanylyltransferase
MAATFDWDDVGAWDRCPHAAADEAGNVLVGDARSWIRAGVSCGRNGRVAFGMEDVVVVRANGTTLVAPRARAPDLKRLLEQLPAELVQEGP